MQIDYDWLNRLKRERDTGGTGLWRDYAYDARGNVIDNDRIAFTYDAANQPVSITGAATGTFQYDGNGKRVKQAINGEEIYSAYSMSGALLYRENTTTNEKTDYVRVAGITVARIKAGITSYLHGDHLGSPVAATTTGGAVQWREDYTPYGEERQDPAANDNDENFTGHIRDEDTGLIYAQARYMDPVIGRFLSGDPVQFSVSRPQYFNRYSYTLNDPVNAIDPDGRASGGICLPCSGGSIPGPQAGRGASQAFQFVSGGKTHNVRKGNGNRGTSGRNEPFTQAVEDTVAVGAAVATLAVPGPEDAVLAVAGATKAGQAISKTANSLMNGVSSKALAKSIEGLPTPSGSTSSVDNVIADINPNTGEITISGGARPTTAGRGESAGIPGRTDAAVSSAERAQTLQRTGKQIKETLETIVEKCGPDGCF